MEPAEAKAHAFVVDLDGPELDADDRHHLERVLRLRPGEAVTVSDGRGRWRVCRFAAGGALEVDGPIVTADEPAPALTIAFALVKGERPEWVVQKLTEVGIDRIVPFVAERSVVRWDEGKAARQHERLVHVAREASMQSRRVWLPKVDPVTTFAEAAALPGAARADRGGERPSLATPVLLVGPEGGWSDAERAAPLRRVGLGPTVLRAETAAVAAGVLLANARDSGVHESEITDSDCP
jgi:16S rRNA (uracil1498-N3)-methyltransferase